MTTIIKLLLYCLLIYGITWFVPGVTIDVVWPTVVIAGVVFFFVNTVIKPVIKILTLPINLVTLGLFSFVINTALFWFVGYLVNGFDVVGVQAAIIGGIIAMFGVWIISLLLDKDD